jgi:hypothetical protein
MRTLRDLLAAALMVGALTLSLPALAQHAHDAHEKGPNGGQVVAVGPYDAEVLLGHDMLTVRLFQHDGTELTVDASGGDVVLLIGGKPVKVALVAENGALVGKLDADLPDEVDAVIRIKTKDGKVHAGKGDLDGKHH